jgi:hypothetical protein
MRRPGRIALACLTLAVASAAADAPKAPGWTADALKAESAACTEVLVKGAWENTKRDQGAEPAMEMTPEIRKQLAPQIAGMASLCECAVREAAKKFGPGDGDRLDFQRYAIDTVQSGRCKLPK